MKNTALHPHDVGLPAAIIGKRRQARRVAGWMLTVAVVTAIVGWMIFGTSVWAAIQVRRESPWQAILAWGMLIISSATLVLGLWYLLLAQVHRVARMVDADGAEAGAAGGQQKCPNCGWPHDGPDRFCRHCGKALGDLPAPSAGVIRPDGPHPLGPDVAATPG